LVKKVLVSVGVFATMTLGLSVSAWAAPNPNPNAPHEKPCVTVLSNNPNTGPGGHISETGGAHFGAVGAALCGLDA
jgi:hypothetical protein